MKILCVHSFCRIIVDLKLGVYYQKCHDPDCRAQNYKSMEHHLPPDILPAFFDDFDDDELLAATEQAEQMQSARVVESVDVHVGDNGGAKCGGKNGSGGETNVRGNLGVGDGAHGSWQDGEFDITDEEMLAAVSELEDSGIEN